MSLLAIPLLTEPPADRLRFSRREAAGALGDLGTFIPLLIGMVTQCGLQLVPAVCFAGLMNLVTGFRFGIPMTIQPMNAISAVAIAEGLSEADILAGGIITGAVILTLGLFRWFDKLAAAVPQGVIRRLQLALGVKLPLNGYWMVIGTGSPSDHNNILLGAFCLFVALLLSHSERLPAALAIFAIGLVWLSRVGAGRRQDARAKERYFASDTPSTEPVAGPNDSKDRPADLSLWERLRRRLLG